MPTITEVSDEVAADLIAEMRTIEFRDLGPTMIHHGLHRYRGLITVMANALGPCFMIQADHTTPAQTKAA
jgi:hypothetical protein